MSTFYIESSEGELKERAEKVWGSSLGQGEKGMFA